MASSKVMASTSPPNPDLPRQSASSVFSSSSSSALTQTIPSSVSNLLQQPNPHPNPTNQLHYSDRSNSPFGSMNMEEILKNIYSEPDSLASAVDDAGISGVAAPVGNRTADEVWKEIVNGGGSGVGGSREMRMTLEDYLTKAGAVSEEDVRVHNSAAPPVPSPASGGTGGYGVETMVNVQFPVAPGPVVHMQNGPGGGYGLESQLGFGNAMVAASAALRGHGGNGSASGRGKRRGVPVEDLALDKASQQKQRRMIKNRESAARSRERKQAYTVELESLVTQLEEENARLLREEAEQNKERFKQLMENLIPVVEKQRPPRVLRRVSSSSW